VVGIQQQLIRRQDRLAKAAPHMQTGEHTLLLVLQYHEISQSYFAVENHSASNSTNVLLSNTCVSHQNDGNVTIFCCVLLINCCLYYSIKHFRGTGEDTVTD